MSTRGGPPGGRPEAARSAERAWPARSFQDWRPGSELDGSLPYENTALVPLWRNTGHWYRTEVVLRWYCAMARRWYLTRFVLVWYRCYAGPRNVRAQYWHKAGKTLMLHWCCTRTQRAHKSSNRIVRANCGHDVNAVPMHCRNSARTPPLRRPTRHRAAPERKSPRGINRVVDLRSEAPVPASRHSRATPDRPPMKRPRAWPPGARLSWRRRHRFSLRVQSRFRLGRRRSHRPAPARATVARLCAPRRPVSRNLGTCIRPRVASKARSDACGAGQVSPRCGQLEANL